MIGINSIYHGDCIDVMKQIDDHCIDCVICDLPFGTTPLEWDSIIDMGSLWDIYHRICKPTTPIILFGQEPFSSYLRLSNISEYRYDWYWEKERLTNVFQVKRRCGKTIETISVFYKKQCTYNPQKTTHFGHTVSNKIGESANFSITQSGTTKQIKPIEYIDDGTRNPTQILRFNRDNMRSRIHPTQKPVDLLEYLILTYSNPGDVILDNCCGSASTCIAALNTGRCFIGIEQNKQYYDSASKRIESACKNMHKQLF